MPRSLRRTMSSEIEQMLDAVATNKELWQLFGGEGCQNHVHSGCGSVVLMHEATEMIAALNIALLW